MGVSAGILFIELQTFYDSVDLVLLIKACSVLESPRIPLLLLVQAFWGPRTLIEMTLMKEYLLHCPSFLFARACN